MATLIYRTLRNMQKVATSGQSWQEIATRFRRNAGQFKTGTLVGTDSYGNKYYEDLTNEDINNLYGRHRWVEFPASINKRNATMIPPEWHGWMHYTTNLKGPEVLEKFGASKPFLIGHSPTRTGTDHTYTPDNYHKSVYFNPDQATGMHSSDRASQVEEKHFARAKTGGFSIDDL